MHLTSLGRGLMRFLRQSSSISHPSNPLSNISIDTMLLAFMSQLLAKILTDPAHEARRPHHAPVVQGQPGVYQKKGVGKLDLLRTECGGVLSANVKLARMLR